MLPKAITSLQHPLIKHLVKLRKERQYRQDMQSLLITGKKLVKERASVDTLFIKQGEHPPPHLQFRQLYSLNASAFAKISGVKSPEPIAAQVPLPPPSDLQGKEKLLALDGINDPGNLGTLIRTARALSFDGLYLTKNCVDLFNEKALRAAKGASLDLPYQVGSQEQLWLLIEGNRFHPYVGDLQGNNVRKHTFHLPLILILGNEAHGLSPQTKQKGEPLTIPLSHKIESLNVAIAGGILMYQIKESLEHG